MSDFEIAPLLDYIPELSPRFEPPTHLAPLLARLERARFEPLRLVANVTVRHGKTEGLLHFIPWLLAQDPTTQIVYASYAARLAEKKSRKARDLARRAGVSIAEDASSRSDWRTGAADGGVWACGVEGSLTGEGADIAIVDDPHKDRASVESALQRQAVWDWFNDTLMTRCEPAASVIVCGARWHEDDLSGRLIAQGWESIVLPAIDDDGRALWPSRFSAEQLQRIREERGEYTWASLYQQRPRPRGGQLFGDVVPYDELPERCSITIGCDLAYSEKTRSDYSVAIVLAHARGVAYVLDVVRAQEEAPKFLSRLERLRRLYPGATWRSYLAGTEKGVATVFKSLGVDLGAMPPIGDKFIRAQPVAAAWNRGAVRLPKAAPWLNALVEELKSFTGVKDRYDDQVDALAAAFDEGDDEDRVPDWMGQSDFAARAQEFLGEVGGQFDPSIFTGPRERKPPAYKLFQTMTGERDLVGCHPAWPSTFTASWAPYQPAQFSPDSTQAFRDFVTGLRQEHPEFQ